jgi:hypothetical protein
MGVLSQVMLAITVVVSVNCWLAVVPPSEVEQRLGVLAVLVEAQGVPQEEAGALLDRLLRPHLARVGAVFLAVFAVGFAMQPAMLKVGHARAGSAVTADNWR